MAKTDHIVVLFVASQHRKMIYLSIYHFEFFFKYVSVPLHVIVLTVTIISHIISLIMIEDERQEVNWS